MNTETMSQFGPEEIERLNRQLAERGFYVIGRLAPASRDTARLQSPNSLQEPSHRV